VRAGLTGLAAAGLAAAGLAAGLAAAGLAAARAGRRRAGRGWPPVRQSPLHGLSAAGDPGGFIDTLTELVRMRTVSDPFGEGVHSAAFSELHRALERRCPRVHAALERDVIEGSLLFTWPGTDPSARPIVLMAHADVVPAELPDTHTAGASGTEWTHPPYDGVVADGFLWGRGTLDDKVGVAGILVAIEGLIAAGFVPRRSIHVAIGHDEELGGHEGAARIADVLRSRLGDSDDQPIELVLDEGGAVTDGLVPGVSAPVALIGVAEKGYVTLELIARGPAGHAMLPPPESAIGILGRAVARLEARPMPARLGAIRQLYAHLAPEMSPGRRFAFSNVERFAPLVTARLSRLPHTAATIRSTMAPTMLQAGTLPNVVPGEARAAVNCRLLPGDSVEDVVAHVRRAIDDARVEVYALDGVFRSDPRPASSTEDPVYEALAGTIRTVFPGVLVAPWTLLGATDSRHLAPLARSVLRFAPVRLGPSDLARIHGRDERLPIASAPEIVGFYELLIRTLAG
jgi:carboxypeptidase PM20D1